MFTCSRILRCAQALLPPREPATPTRVRETSGLTGGNCSSPQRRCGPEPLKVFRGSSCIGTTPSSGSCTQFPFGNQGSPLVPEAQGVAYPPLLRKEVCLFDFAASSRAACFGFILKTAEANFGPDFKTLSTEGQARFLPTGPLPGRCRSSCHHRAQRSRSTFSAHTALSSTTADRPGYPTTEVRRELLSREA